MKYVYDHYDLITESKELKENSDYVRENYSWEKIANIFKNDILPKLVKSSKITKVITLLTSFDRPHHIENMMNSLKEIREPKFNK